MAAGAAAGMKPTCNATMILLNLHFKSWACFLAIIFLLFFFDMVAAAGWNSVYGSNRTAVQTSELAIGA
jgi:hypothetical protein